MGERDTDRADANDKSNVAADGENETANTPRTEQPGTANAAPEARQQQDEGGGIFTTVTAGDGVWVFAPFIATGVGMGLVATALIGTFTSGTGPGAVIIRQVVTVIDVVVLGMAGPVVAGFIGVHYGVRDDPPDAVALAGLGAVGHAILFLGGAAVVVLLLGGGVNMRELLYPAVVGAVGAGLAAVGGMHGMQNRA